GKPVGTPDASSFFRVVSEHGVCGMFSAPTAMRVIRKEDPEGHMGKKFPGKKLRYLFLAGERCDQETLRWAEKAFGVPTLDNWWQTGECTQAQYTIRYLFCSVGSMGTPC
ncbi:hypothetical protein MRX96_051044, partial [Rhipicephalus microplus]